MKITFLYQTLVCPAYSSNISNFVNASISVGTSISTGITATLAQEQKPEVSQQPQTGTFIMIMELQYLRETAPDFVRSHVYNMTTNMKNFDQNNTVEYDVKDIDVTIDDSQIYFRLPFKIVDISTVS
jgi:hypothetical protein